VNRIDDRYRLSDRIELPTGWHEQAIADWLTTRADSRTVWCVPVTFHQVFP
jgi:hypothetical protein